MEGTKRGEKFNYLVKLRTLRTSTGAFLTLLPDMLRLGVQKSPRIILPKPFSGLPLMTPSTDSLHGNYWCPLGGPSGSPALPDTYLLDQVTCRFQ